MTTGKDRRNAPRSGSMANISGGAAGSTAENRSRESSRQIDETNTGIIKCCR